MSGSTTELNLSTAVDADDNADYLTINLANSLRTVDGLFNNVTGHTHGGAHQGGPISPAAGSIPGSAITDATITNAKLGPDVARANLLTNGGFEIWQRGNGPFTTAGLFGPDRWLLQISGTSTMSVSKDTTNVDTGSGAAAAITYSHNVASLLQHKVEDYLQLRGRPVSLSVRVRTNVANAVRARVDHAVVQNYSTFHTGDNTWQTLTVTTTVGGSTTALYAFIEFDASCTAYIDNAMLVVGSQPADYAPLHPADDLARCLRYYERRADSYLAAGYMMGATTGEFVVPTALKGGTPTVTYGPAVGNFAIRIAGSNIACNGVIISAAMLNGVLVNPTLATSQTQLQGVTFSSIGGGWVSSEWNP
jgi:hypothetical protein